MPTATKKKPKAKPKTNEAPPHVRATAESILGAIFLLGAIEQRMRDPSRDPLPVSWPERQSLAAVLPELADATELRRAVQQARAARLGREAGVSRKAIADAEAALVEAKQAEQNTAATIADLDVTDDASPALVRQVRTLEKKFAKLRGKRVQAEVAVSQARSALAAQVERVPKPLRDRVAARRERVVHEAGIDRLRAAIHRVNVAEEVIRRVEAEPNWGVESRINSWWPYLEAECPEAIVKDSGGRKIEPAAIKAHANELGRNLDAMRAEVADLRARVEAAAEGVDEVLHLWAENGSVSPESITELMG